MSAQDQMSPDTSPGEVSKKSGVRRVNNMPVFILFGLMGVFLLIMILVAADRAENQNKPGAAKEEKAGSTSMFANEIAGGQDSGMIPALNVPGQEDQGLVAPETTEALAIARPDNLDAPPMPPGNSGLDHQRSNDELDRIRMAKMQQLEEAIKAKTGVQVIAPRSSGSSGGYSGVPNSRDEALARIAEVRQQIDAQTRDDPTAAYQARLQQIRASGIGGTGSMGGSSAPQLLQTATGKGKDYSQFGNTSQEDRWKLDARPEAPRSPYELRAGFVVPATLISGINSDLPGQIMAQVSQDVFDTATGKYKLVPQGSRLVGSYSSDVAYGQARVLIAWQRIVFPDGKAMDIGSMPGADSAGYSGFGDKVNNHYLRVFGSAFLMSGVTAGIAMSQDNGSDSVNGRPTASSAMSEALGQQLGQVTAQLISKNLNISPTLEIRPGYRFNVIVTKDMTFSKPYQAFDY